MPSPPTKPNELFPGPEFSREVVDGELIITRSMVSEEGWPTKWIGRWRVVQITIPPAQVTDGDEIVRHVPALGLVVVRREISA